MISCKHTNRVVTGRPDHSPSFFIQSKGLHAGRPLRNYIPNCFSVYTQIPFAFELIDCIYSAGYFKYFQIGSVVPYIRIRVVRGVIDSLSLSSSKFESDLKKIQKLTNLINQFENLQSETSKLQQAYMSQVVKELHLPR